MGREKTSWYTVYDPGTDEVLACGNSDECGRILGVKCFRVIVHRVKKGTIKSYVIAKEDTKSGSYEVYGTGNAETSKKRKNQLIKKYHDMGYNDQTIADMVGCAEYHVENWRRYHGLPSNRKRGRPRKETVSE